MPKKKKITAAEREHYKTRLLMELTGHVGRARVIGMGELFEAVFDERYASRINDTRALRTLITELRGDGVPICSAASTSGGGYWIASAGSELDDQCARLRRQALKKLSLEAKLRKLALPDLLGQIQLEWSNGDDDTGDAGDGIENEGAEEAFSG